MGHINDSVIRSVLEQYGLKLLSAAPVSSAYKNEAAYKALTNGGAYLIKPFAGDSRRLSAIASAVRQLKHERYKHMPYWLKTKRGDRFVRHFGRLFYVTEWIDGDKLGERIDNSDYRGLGAALGKLHNIGMKRNGTCTQMEKLRLQQRLFSAKLPKLRREASSIGNWFREESATCEKLGAKAWQMLGGSELSSKLRNAGTVLLHGDVTSPNVIVNEHRICLVDWENMRYGSAYFELVKALSNTTAFSIPLMSPILDGYSEQRFLHGSEKRIVAALFRIPREAWYVGLRTDPSKTESLLESLKRSWKARLEAIEWMDNWARG